MKKVIAGTLITAMVSNNMVYADTIKNEFLEVSDNVEVMESVEELLENNENVTQQENDKTETNFGNELPEKKEEADLEQLEENKVEVISDAESTEKKESVDTVQSIEKTTVKTDINVSNYDQLKTAVTQSNVNINIISNIKFDNPINITGKNITINGDGKTFDLNQTDTTNRFVIKGNADNIEINNLTFDNYTTIGIYVSGKNVALKDITLTGEYKNSTANGRSKVGMDVVGSTVTIENLTSKNHSECGIRLREEAKVEFSGNNSHENDNDDIKMVVLNNASESVITDNTSKYIKTSETNDKDKKNIFYSLRKTIDVTDFTELEQAVTVNNAIININNTIELEQELNITGKNITINGNDNTIDLKDSKNKIVVKSTSVGTTLSNINFENYTSSAILVYNTKDITLDNIKLLGTDKKSSVGIDVSNSTATIKNITSKNHIECGIRLRDASTVTFEGNNTHENDTAAIRSMVKDGQDKNKIHDVNGQYLKTDEKVDSANTKNEYYNTQKIVSVGTFEELKDAITIPNSLINITQDITLKENLEIKANYVTIDGNNFKFDLGNVDSFSVKAKNITLKNLEFANYKTTGLTLYGAKDVSLYKLKLSGKDISLPNKERSTVGIDIFDSTVKIDDISSNNNLYRGIQVRGGSTVDILSRNLHTNDTVHMQSIKKTGEQENIINDPNGLYVKGTEKNNKENSTIDYFSRVDVNISTAKDFINNINNNGNVLHIMNDIQVESSDLPAGSDISELVVNSNILIEGNGRTIDLNKLVGITLKGNDIILKDLTIKNAKDIGVNIYNSRDILLENVSVENSYRYGIFVNGSTVKLEDCSTKNNNGGIMITRSRTLRSESHIDSRVEVIGSIHQEESNINVGVTNLQMIDGYFQKNEFVVADNIYDKYVNDVESKVLSEHYLNLFEIKGEERNKKYDEQTTDYMIIKTVIDVQNHSEVLDENGQPIRLAGDGVTDDTQNLKKLIEYAASHGRELYFPEGIYKITADIDLSTINLPALSNFKLSGATNGLSIFDGSSSVDKMLKIMNAEYHSKMNYVNINNIVFNNIGLEFNGPYKKGISLNNNVFMNGQYTRETNAAGEIRKVTMEPYITAKNNKYVIEENAFLRGVNYPGRGIATYRTNNTTIKDNFFGNLEGLSDAATMLPDAVINKLNLIQVESQSGLSEGIKISGSQGNFLTAINNERYDENVNIYNNYFNMDKTRNITGDFGTDVLISGINVAVDGQRRDHIIYSKGYTNLNIYGNYFEGMENGAAGGVKIRNGEGAYVGSNHFKDVPLLTYIYGDLTKEECILYNTTIYNNLFHQTTNFGGQGTGILYYQSFRDGQDLQFKEDSWIGAYGDVQNFVIYNNEFMSDERDQITISNRAVKAYEDNQFLAYGNKYAEDKNISVNYNKGNFSLSESTEAEVLNKVNSGFAIYNTVDIPLTPAKVDHTYLNSQINEANEFYNNILTNGQIGIFGGQHPESAVNELKNLILETQQLIDGNALTQWETNKRLTLIQETLEKLKTNINDRGLAPTVTVLNDVTINIGEEFDPYAGVIFEDDRDTSENLKILVDLDSFDNTISGEYIITYSVTDSDGNTTKETRKVIVRSNEKPVISGIGTTTINVGENFDPMSGVIITDDNDSIEEMKVTVDLGNFDNNAPGTYIIKYTIEDSDGNITVAEREVIVLEDIYNSVNDEVDDEIKDEVNDEVKNEQNNKEEINSELNNTQNPNTGDQSNILNWALAGLISLIGLLFVNRKRKKVK